jgi:hypothetical protein
MLGEGILSWIVHQMSIAMGSAVIEKPNVVRDVEFEDGLGRLEESMM